MGLAADVQGLANRSQVLNPKGRQKCCPFELRSIIVTEPGVPTSVTWACSVIAVRVSHTNQVHLLNFFLAMPQNFSQPQQRL